MKVSPNFLYTVIILLSYNGYSQNPKQYSTDKIGESYAYINVTKTYERIAEKGYKSVDLFEKLGNSYYNNMNMEKAAKWYGELFAMTSDLDAIYYNQYAKSLCAIGEDEKANLIIENLNKRLKLKREKRYSKKRRSIK